MSNVLCLVFFLREATKPKRPDANKAIEAGSEAALDGLVPSSNGEKLDVWKVMVSLNVLTIPANHSHNCVFSLKC